jgi:uncharacterized protein DUF4412
MNRLLGCAFVLLVSIAAPSAGHADWKGTINIQGAGNDKVTSGMIFAQRGKVRFEMNAQGHPMIVITDVKGQSASMLMPAQKMAMEMPAALADKKMISCSVDDIEGCLKTKGFKKTGDDTVDGHPCAVYEADSAAGETKAHQKLWRPTDMKEVFMIKSVSVAENREVTMTIKDIKFGKLETSLFTVPADYKKMQMPDLGALRH